MEDKSRWKQYVGRDILVLPEGTLISEAMDGQVEDGICQHIQKTMYKSVGLIGSTTQQLWKTDEAKYPGVPYHSVPAEGIITTQHTFGHMIIQSLFSLALPLPFDVLASGC